MDRKVTCIGVSVYGDNITRGTQYILAAEDGEKRQARIKDNKGRLRWFPISCFDFENRPVSALVSWQYYNEIESDAQTWIPDISLTLGNGSRHFCLLATPQTLTHVLSRVQPYFWSRHLIVVSSYKSEVVEQVLRELDALGHLAEATYFMGPDEVEDILEDAPI